MLRSVAWYKLTDVSEMLTACITIEILPNVVVKWLKFLLRIRVVPVSILAPGDQLPILINVFRGFPQSLHANTGIVP
jgi:hypothetical protein